MSDFSKNLIDQLRSIGPETEYLLPIYSHGMSEMEKEAKRRDLIKSINSNLAKLSRRAGLDCKVTTYYARHSYTTVALNNGTSLEMLRETLGHRDIKTTMNYVGSFRKSKLRDLADKVTEFLEK